MGGQGTLPRDEAINLYKGIEGLDEDRAAVLYDKGYRSLETLRDAPVKELTSLEGIDESLAETVRTSAAALLGPAGSNDALRRWLSGDNGDGLSSWLGGAGADSGGNGDTVVKTKAATNSAALRKWLSGEEDALDDWIGSDTEAKLPMSFEIRADTELPTIPAVADEELDRIKKELARFLEQAKSGDLDPVKMLEERAAVNAELERSRKRMQELEDEVKHVKKGSIAVIKYIKAQQLKTGSEEMKKQLTEEANHRKELEIKLKHQEDLVKQMQERLEKGAPASKKQLVQRESEIAKREAELSAKMEELEAFKQAADRGELDIGGAGASVELQQRLQEELRQKQEEWDAEEKTLQEAVSESKRIIEQLRVELKVREEAAALEGKSSGEVSSVLKEKERELAAKEKSILVRTQEIDRLKEQVQFKDEELKKLKEPLAYKEEELARREQEVEFQLKKIEAERRKVEEAKALGGSTEELELKQRLDQLKGEITAKEEEVRAKEKYLKAKMEELRLREQGLVEEELEARDQEREMELSMEKARTGIARLDDLLLGGIPFGSCVMIHGPAFVGKEVIVNMFMGEALKKGIPVIWVLTDKGPTDLRDEMRYVLPSYEQYETMGLVKYIDAYSATMGVTEEQEDKNAVYVQDPQDSKEILSAVELAAKAFKEKHRSYRLAFRSISALIPYMDMSTAFRFLQPLIGRRKRDSAISMFVIEKGMHGDQEIQMLGSLMDGTIEFKLEQLKSFMRVRGIGEVQSRAWIEYTASKGNVTIRSFSLGHIK